MTVALLTLGLVLPLAALVVGARWATHHEEARTERGYLAGAGAPLDIVRDACDRRTHTGDVLMTEVCRCGATRPCGTSRWSLILHRPSR